MSAIFSVGFNVVVNRKSYLQLKAESWAHGQAPTPWCASPASCTRNEHLGHAVLLGVCRPVLVVGLGPQWSAGPQFRRGEGHRRKERSNVSSIHLCRQVSFLTSYGKLDRKEAWRVWSQAPSGCLWESHDMDLPLRFNSQRREGMIWEKEQKSRELERSLNKGTEFMVRIKVTWY